MCSQQLQSLTSQGPLIELLKGIIAITPTEVDKAAVALNQNPEEEERLTNFQAILEDVLKVVKDVKNRSAEVSNCHKDVHFVTNLPSASRLFLWVATLDSTQNGFSTQEPKTLNDVLNCSFLIVSDKNARYELGHVKKIPNCHIFITSTKEFPIEAIIFHSGSEYVLSNGYSVKYCWNLKNAAELRLH